MKNFYYLFLIFSCFSFLMPVVSFAGSSPVEQLVKDLERSGISQKDIKAVNKELGNLLAKGGKQEDIGRIITGISKNGVSGGNLTTIIKMWSELLNAGGSHKNTNELFHATIDQGKKQNLKGNDFAAIIQNALQQKRHGMKGAGSNADLHDLIAVLERNGVTQNEIKSLDGPLRNMLEKGGDKKVMGALLTDMVQKGVTGTYLWDSVTAWNNDVNAGAGNKAAHDTIAGVLADASSKGLKDRDLAAAIQAALLHKQGLPGGQGDAALNELLGSLKRNGVTQKDLNAIDKQLGNLLKSGGDKNMMNALLQDMVRNGVTGTYLMDSVNTWNNQVNAGLGNKRSHDIIAQVLDEAKKKGIKDKQLAAMIEDALRQRR